MAGDDDRMESPSPDPQLGSTDALRAEIEQLRKDKANADAQQQSLLQQLTDARAAAPASAPGSDLTEQDRAELERLREADHARQLEEARLRLPANIDDIDCEFGNNLRLYPRQKPYTAGNKIPSAHEWTVNEGYWLDLVGAKTPKWASIAASNLADGTTRTQFWTASPVSKEHATIMSWDQFKQTMVLAFGSVDMSKIGRQHLYDTKQGTRTAQAYVNDFRAKLTEIPEETRPNQHDLMFFFNKGLNDTLQTLTSINFSTMKPFENVDDMTNAAIMLGNSSIAALDKPGSSNSGNSNKKRQNEAAVTRSPAKKLNQGASTSSGGNHMGAKTDKRRVQNALSRKMAFPLHACLLVSIPRIFSRPVRS